MEEGKKILGYSLVLKSGETDSGLNSSGCKTLAWKGPFAAPVSGGSLFIGLLSVPVQKTSLANCLKGVVHCKWRTTIAHLGQCIFFPSSSQRNRLVTLWSLAAARFGLDHICNSACLCCSLLSQSELC